jgi:hypothetical protein
VRLVDGGRIVGIAIAVLCIRLRIVKSIEGDNPRSTPY